MANKHEVLKKFELKLGICEMITFPRNVIVLRHFNLTYNELQ